MSYKYNGSRLVNISGYDANIQLHVFPEGDDLISDYIADHSQFFEHEVLADIARKHPHHSSIIDAGAHIGNHTRFFARFLNCENIFAFEPFAPSRIVLHENAKAHNEKRKSANDPFIIVSGEFLSSYEECEARGKIGLAEIGDKNLGMVVGDKNSDVMSVQHTANVVTLDHAMECKGFPHVSLIKVDCETHSLEVLLGARRILARYKPVLYVEALSIQEFRLILNYLRQFGYSANYMPSYTDHTVEFRCN